jgi:hypothetical protein
MSPINPLNPWLLLGALGVAAMIAISSGYEGYHLSSLYWQHRVDAIYQQARLVADAEQEKAHEAAISYEKGHATARVVYQTVHDQSIQVIHDNITYYTGECLDVDGLRNANAALAGPSAAGRSPNTTMPGPDTATGRSTSDSVAQVRGGQ